MEADYAVAFSGDGAIRALSADVFLNCGVTKDLSGVAAMEILLHAESGYDVPGLRLRVQTLHTDLPAATAVRAPGGPKAALLIETVIEHVAAATGLPPHAVREANLLAATAPAERLCSPAVMGPSVPYTGYNLPAIWARVQERAGFGERMAAAEAFNAAHRWRKRGVSAVPSRYVCGLFGQMEVLVQVTPEPRTESRAHIRARTHPHARTRTHARTHAHRVVPCSPSPQPPARAVSSPCRTVRLPAGACTTLQMCMPEPAS